MAGRPCIVRHCRVARSGLAQRGACPTGARWPDHRRTEDRTMIATSALKPGSLLLLRRYLLDPMGLYLLERETSQILFFPSITVAAASLVLLAFRETDCWSLD